METGESWDKAEMVLVIEQREIMLVNSNLKHPGPCLSASAVVAWEPGRRDLARSQERLDTEELVWGGMNRSSGRENVRLS